MNKREILKKASNDPSFRKRVIASLSRTKVSVGSSRTLQEYQLLATEHYLNDVILQLRFKVKSEGFRLISSKLTSTKMAILLKQNKLEVLLYLEINPDGFLNVFRNHKSVLSRPYVADRLGANEMASKLFQEFVDQAIWSEGD